MSENILTDSFLCVAQQPGQGEVEREYHVDLVKQRYLENVVKGNLQKAEVEEEEEAQGRIKLIVLGDAGLKVIF